MAILDFFRSKPIREAYTIITDRSIPTITEQVSGGKGDVDRDINVSEEIGEKHPYSFELLENAYLQVPIVKGAIDKTVDFVIGPGFYINTKSQSAKTIIEDFMREQDFDTYLRRVIRDMLIFGSSFSEVIRANGTIKLKPLNPKFIFVRRDAKGKILGYTQYKMKDKPISFAPDEIIHLAFDQLGDSPYGTSMIRPLMGSANVNPLFIYLQSQKISNTILTRRGNPPIHVKVGTDQFPATTGDVAAVANELGDLRSINEFVTDHRVVMDVLQYRGRIPELQPFFDNYENIIIYGIQVPAVLLGRANVPEGLANVQMDAFERHAKSIQAFAEKGIEKNIFSLIVGELVEFEWGQPTFEMEDIELKRLMNLLKTPDLSPKTKAEIENRIRTILGLEKLDPDMLAADLAAKAELKAKSKEPTRDGEPMDSPAKTKVPIEPEEEQFYIAESPSQDIDFQEDK